ncbi:ER lumen protein-retaining receptor 1-like [Mytilus edulis]|uniref:ER lumen protein-retaining receptor 1-like n=1 Tax=Mytilus edulis TaxID=6550 RepID=UPI0039EE875A
MTIIQFCGDMLHILAVISLLIYLWKYESLIGISGKSQIMYALVFTTRYMDLFIWPTVYRTIVKVTFIISSYLTVYLIYVKFKHTNDNTNDTFRVKLLVIPACVLAFFVNNQFSIIEILWTFSIYLECVAMLPQFWMMIWNGEAGRFVCFYLCAMGSYRVFYIMHWIYIENSNGGNLNLISFISGNLQSCLYWVFLTVYINKLRESRKQKIKPSSTLQDGLIMTLSPRWPGFGVQRDL